MAQYDSGKRYTKTEDRWWDCPLCAAHGIDTRVAGPTPTHIIQDLPYYREIDDGGTEPLCGPLCRECRKV